jgi:hypothetical protein
MSTHTKEWHAWGLNPMFGYSLVLPSKPRSFKYSSSFRVYYENCLCLSLLSYLCLMLCLSHTPVFFIWSTLQDPVMNTNCEALSCAVWFVFQLLPTPDDVSSKLFDSFSVTRQVHYLIRIYCYIFPRKSRFLQVYSLPIESIVSMKKCPDVIPSEGAVLSQHNVIISFE